MVNRIFDKKNVILLKVNEDDLNTFLVDMDIDDEGNPKYCLDDFTKAICNTIPEYVFAQYEDPNIPQNDIVEKLREAAHCIYKIKDFQLMKQWCVDKDINVILSILVDTFISKISFPMQPGPEIGSISDA